MHASAAGFKRHVHRFPQVVIEEETNRHDKAEDASPSLIQEDVTKARQEEQQSEDQGEERFLVPSNKGPDVRQRSGNLGRTENRGISKCNRSSCDR